jgi:hypothetical protein
MKEEEDFRMPGEAGKVSLGVGGPALDPRLI